MQNKLHYAATPSAKCHPRLMVLAALILGLVLSACSRSPNNLVASASAADSQSRQADARTKTNSITQVRVSKVNDQRCKQAPVTFGQPFIKGDVPRGQSVYAQLNGRKLPTQVNIKARNQDGSARHAVITILAPCDPIGGSGTNIALVAGQPSDTSASGPSIKNVLNTDFNTRVELAMNGQRWHLDARSLLQKIRAGGCDGASIFCKRWLRGPLASEWVVGAPLKNAVGQKHPHLMAYFAIRAYGPAPVARVRTDVAVENDWAYVANPQNYHYQPTIKVAGRSQPAYQPEAFTHYRQARWHHVVWWGESDNRPLYAKLNPRYLQNTAAVPRYANGRLSSKLLHQRQSCAPMKHCGQTKHMGQTGAQAAIGPLPRWSAAFVINPDYRIFRWMLANTDALGGYGFHYRQRDTGEPLSVRDHPCATTVWNARQASCNAPPHGDDRFPKCDNDCKSPLSANTAHHPAPAYTAYLATGDWYYASEMTFIANWVVFWQNPGYRDYRKGLIHRQSTRGQAWSLRTLTDAAYLLPDQAAHKKFLNRVVANNIAWYTEHYADNPDANKLGVLDNHTAYTVNGDRRTGTATWQQSFFAWSLGNMVDQRFAGAEPVRDWFSRFQISLMTSPDYCWPLASAYKLRVLKTTFGKPYETLGKVYRKSFPKNVVAAGCEPEPLNAAIKEWQGVKHFHYPPNTMVGYPKSATGFPANFQIGLAADYNSSLPGAQKAWSIFASRPVQPSYRSSPQFAVVPTRNR